MPTGTAPTCDCIGSFPPVIVQQWIYCMLYQINQNTGGGTGSDQYTSSPMLATGNGSIPAGVLGWSITAVSGTVTVNGAALAIGATARGGGYESLTLASAIAYTVSGGSALVSYDTPT